MRLAQKENNYKRFCLLNIMLFFIFFSSFSQINKIDPLSVCLNPKIKKSTGDSSMNHVLWKEKVNKRTLYSSTYYGPNGEFKAIHSKRPINYYNEKKELVPIDISLKPQPDKFWVAYNQPNPTYFFKNTAAYALTLGSSENLFTLGVNSKIDNENLDLSNIVKENNSFIIKNAIPGVDKELYFLEDAIKFNYILNQKVVTSNSYIVFSEEVRIPNGYTLEPDFDFGKKDNNFWMGDLILKNPNKKIVSKIKMPICIDANKETLPGLYNVKKQNGKIIIEILIEKNWVNDVNRAFPIIVDPLIVGPSYIWAGPNMPSCVMNNHNVDSILVTRPASVTLTGCHVTSNFYAMFFSGAVKADGSMFFSTDCGTTQAFNIVGPNANTAGTAYLDSFQLMNPLTCCIPESCSDTSFYIRKHLGRLSIGTNTGLPLGVGCNTTYIMHDAISLWPFKVVLFGRTPESYGNEWVVPPIPKCANDCAVTGYAYVRYGVAPYTFSHPWSTQVVTLGQNNGCSSGATNFNFDMTIPNCPIYCDTSYTELSVPPPQILDACGTQLLALVPDTVPIKPVPQIFSSGDTLSCSQDDYIIPLESCISNTVISSWGNGTNGQDTIFDNVENNSSASILIDYYASGILDGCYSDTANFSMIIQPLPQASFTYSSPIISGVPVSFIDQSIDPASFIQSWHWQLDDSTVSVMDYWENIFNIPGTYNLCVDVVNEFGCLDTVCELIDVFPAEIKVPNIISSNDDGVNDFLEFEFLQFYPNNELTIWNRWGNVVYKKSGYQNDWNGNDVSEGTYFFILKNLDKNETHSGFFQIVK